MDILHKMAFSKNAHIALTLILHFLVGSLHAGDIQSIILDEAASRPTLHDNHVFIMFGKNKLGIVHGDFIGVDMVHLSMSLALHHINTIDENQLRIFELDDGILVGLDQMDRVFTVSAGTHINSPRQTPPSRTIGKYKFEFEARVSLDKQKRELFVTIHDDVKTYGQTLISRKDFKDIAETTQCGKIIEEFLEKGKTEIGLNAVAAKTLSFQSLGMCCVDDHDTVAICSRSDGILYILDRKKQAVIANLELDPLLLPPVYQNGFVYAVTFARNREHHHALTRVDISAYLK